MQLGQVIRRFATIVRNFFGALAPPNVARTPNASPGPRRSAAQMLRKNARALLIALPILIAFYYVGGALLMNNINTDPNYMVADDEVASGESYSIAVASGLLDREINQHGWVANDPFFLPTALLDNMANFQLGIVAGIAEFTGALSSALSGQGIDDSDLKSATDRLRRPGTVWLWDTSRPLGFLGRSESQYREGLLALEGYNVGLTERDTGFPNDAASLKIILDSMAATLADAADRLSTTAAAAPPMFGNRADDAFYFVRGLVYAQEILMKGLGRDYASVIRIRGLEDSWRQTIAAMAAAAALDPLMVMNGAPDAWLFPSHLETLGFRVLRARQMLERASVALAS